MTTRESENMWESGPIILKAKILGDAADCLLMVVEGKQRVSPEVLIETANALRERGDHLIHEHGELLGRRDTDNDEHGHWKFSTELVVTTREKISQAWSAATGYAVELRYPTGPKGWWYALLRALGLRKGIDRKTPTAQS